MCGKIQCQSSAKKPQGTNTVSIDTTIRFKGREVKCRGTFVYSAKDDQEDLSDPGLVLTGTKCGDGMVSAPSWGGLSRRSPSLGSDPAPGCTWLFPRHSRALGQGSFHICRCCLGDTSTAVTRCL